MATYYCKVTDTGRAKLAASTQGDPLKLSKMAVGDGNGASYDPADNATALVNEQYRGDINSVTVDADNPNWVLCEMVIPPATGGWYIRETGIFDVDGDLIAIGKYPDTYKPVLDDGTSTELVIRMVLEIVNADNVTLLVDPDIVMASQTYVNTQVTTVRNESSIVAQIPGGLTHQVLAKKSNTDGDVKWVSESNPRVYFRGQF